MLPDPTPAATLVAELLHREPVFSRCWLCRLKLRRLARWLR